MSLPYVALGLYRVTARNYGHQFEVGQEVRAVSLTMMEGEDWCGRFQSLEDEEVVWTLCNDEVEVVE